MTIRQFTSNILTTLKADSIDNWLSPKYIYEESLTVTKNYLKKDNSSNLMLYSQIEGWSVLPCIEMEVGDLASCGLDVSVCTKVMKSKKRLPEIYTSKVAPLIKEVASVDYSKTYTYIKTFNQWKNTQKREFISKRYFVISDGYLFIPIGKKDNIESPEVVVMNCYAVSKQEVDVFNGVESCRKFADYELVIPSYLIDDVKTSILNSLRQVYLQIQEDAMPNLNSQEKSNPKTLG